MIIAIPMDENKETICVSFGRAPYYRFDNIKTDTTEIIVNPAAQAAGGAGIKAAQFVIDQKADTLITVRCGQNASEVLLAAGVTIYKSTDSSAADNLKALAEGKLETLTHFHPGFHGQS